MLDLASASNWQEIYRGFHYAQPVAGDPRAYTPIPPITLANPVTPGYLAIDCSSEEARAWWYLGCNLIAKINWIGGTTYGEVVTQRERVPVNRGLTLFFLPKLGDSNYEITLDIPYWHQTMSLTVLDYVGDGEFQDISVLTP